MRVERVGILIGLLLMIIGVLLLCLASWLTWTGDLLESCRKQHNVYECKIIAVPTGSHSDQQVNGISERNIRVPVEKGE